MSNNIRASKTIGELTALDKNNKEITRLIQSINNALQNTQAQSPIFDWLNSLANFRLRIEQMVYMMRPFII